MCERGKEKALENDDNEDTNENEYVENNDEG